MNRIKAAIDAFLNPPTVKMNTHAHHCYAVEITKDGHKSFLYYENEEDAVIALDYYDNDQVPAKLIYMMEIVE